MRLLANERNIKCPEGHEFKTGPKQAIDLSNPDVSEKAAEEQANFKHDCTECNETFCFKCKTKPFHDGYSC